MEILDSGAGKLNSSYSSSPMNRNDPVGILTYGVYMLFMWEPSSLSRAHGGSTVGYEEQCAVSKKGVKGR